MTSKRYQDILNFFLVLGFYTVVTKSLTSPEDCDVIYRLLTRAGWPSEVLSNIGILLIYLFCSFQVILHFVWTRIYRFTYIRFFSKTCLLSLQNYSNA